MSTTILHRGLANLAEKRKTARRAVSDAFAVIDRANANRDPDAVARALVAARSAIAVHDGLVDAMHVTAEALANGVAPPVPDTGEGGSETNRAAQSQEGPTTTRDRARRSPAPQPTLDGLGALLTTTTVDAAAQGSGIPKT